MGALLLVGMRSGFLECFPERKADSSPAEMEGHVKPSNRRAGCLEHSSNPEPDLGREMK